jgi:large subunit ribosomal protein L5
MTQRLRRYYETTVVPALTKQFAYSNPHQVPRIQKIVVNRGVGEASQNTKLLEGCLEETTRLTGQRGVITRSKKAIAGFKIRADLPIGVSVTLRGERMYGFLDRFVNLALPRIRDFQGVDPQSFDGHGNYSLGLEEQLMFPEIDYDSIEQLRGMDVSIVTTAKTDQEGRVLLKELGMPFRDASTQAAV